MAELPIIPPYMAIVATCALIVLAFAVALWIAFVVPLQALLELEKNMKKNA